MASFTNFFCAMFMALSLAVIASAGVNQDYVPNPNLDKSELEKEDLLHTLIGVQGLIYCKLGPKILPVEGAVARVTCDAVDEYGYETEAVTILSGATDAKGYYLATLSPFEVQNNIKIKDCRAFLETSPFMKTCNVASDVNKGITGAVLKSVEFLSEKKMKLFSVGPFFYTTGPKSSVSDGY
ncbi:protein SEED AND ROOT HAIR PROTECTIVE PROTEIN-like [Mercurialis annua]|uniref:protein SEED AND ROOT HAIR PROTECTIVE PROTEIN-like n=1 Tax=Mercurialis annua TaxID=3986 RepID=UPI00215E9F0D|nr:protein SEED AND ROOT HAIR PROTECTIVE PROTEIN-like [Mercurialis annua]